MEQIQHLKISLDEILLATNNFSNENSIGCGAFGKVYVATLVICGHERTVAIKRLDDTSKQGQQEFLAEVQILSGCRHKNIVSLLGFCNDGGEKILVYEYAVHGSLDKYLNGSELHWMRRLEISIGAARGLKYLHNDVGPQHRVLHRDIKSSNILLNEDWEAKISDFGLSKIGPSNVEFTFLVTNACGTLGYVDPQYYKTGILTKESDVYSFGVVLFEILCGTLAQKKNQDDGPLLSSLAQSYYEQNRLAEIIHPDLKTQVKAESLKMFSKVAYQCLEDDKTERPMMAWVVDKLEKALEIQDDRNVAGCMRIGTWGGKSNWSFKLERGHRLLKLTIDHGERIYSVAFTSEYCGVLHNSTKFGSFASGDTVSEVMFDVNEEITSINGTTSTQNGSTFISSLSFQTTKRAHGPFGQSTKNDFSVPWDKCSLMGFYGVSGDYIESIGVYLKAYEETIRVGTWGRDKPDNFSWSFNLNKNHRLKKIIVDHGDILYSLMFTSEYRRSLYSTNKVGGWNGGGDHLTEVIFDLDEEIHGINGTVAVQKKKKNGTVGVSEGIVPPCPIISSISFVTNKRTYGPFGEATGTFFNVEWEDASFAGFYGFGGWYIDSIGVYLKSTT